MTALEGQKVVVTGGSRGLGLGIVEALVAQNAQVTVVARDPQRLAEVSQRLGVNVVRGDVTDEKLARGVHALSGVSQDVPALYCARQSLVNAGLNSRMKTIALSISTLIAGSQR